MKPEEKEDDFASFQADATSWWGQNIYPHHQWRSCCHETLAQKIGIAKQMTTVTHTFQQPVNVPAGTKIRIGIVGKQQGWGNGGGIQYELMNHLKIGPDGAFTNRRALP